MQAPPSARQLRRAGHPLSTAGLTRPLHPARSPALDSLVWEVALQTSSSLGCNFLGFQETLLKNQHVSADFQLSRMPTCRNEVTRCNQ